MHAYLGVSCGQIPDDKAVSQLPTSYYHTLLVKIGHHRWQRLKSRLGITDTRKGLSAFLDVSNRVVQLRADAVATISSSVGRLTIIKYNTS